MKYRNLISPEILSCFKFLDPFFEFGNSLTLFSDECLKRFHTLNNNGIADNHRHISAVGCRRVVAFSMNQFVIMLAI